MGHCNQELCVGKVPIFLELSEEKILEINKFVRKKEYKMEMSIY